ncbi:MAG: division/cell wall cluster transcriptional repressor MraZ [Polyangiales bacterium]
MFRGRYEHAIDGKGRTSLPSRFRDVLAASGDCRVVITSGIDPCVVAHPWKQWLELEERLAKFSKFDESVAMLRRIYVSGAVDSEIDKLGRLLIPATLRAHAGLRREAIWAGMGDHIELWDKGRYEGLRDAVLSDPEKRQALVKRLAELGL